MNTATQAVKERFLPQANVWQPIYICKRKQLLNYCVTWWLTRRYHTLNHLPWITAKPIYPSHPQAVTHSWPMLCVKRQRQRKNMNIWRIRISVWKEIFWYSLSLSFFKLHFSADEKLLTTSLVIWSRGLDLALIELLDPISSLKAH